MKRVKLSVKLGREAREARVTAWLSGFVKRVRRTGSCFTRNPPLFREGFREALGRTGGET